MANDINKIPSSWVETNIEELCLILDSARIPINAKERNARIEGKDESELYPYYGATGEVGKIDGYLFEGEHILLGEDGAPFLDPFKDKAYMVNGQFWVNNHAHILKSVTSNKFICHYLNQFNYSDFVTGTTRLKLNQSSLKQIPLPLPPLNEQKRIVAKIEELFAELDAGVASLELAQAQLQTYRQALLKHAFEGKLTAEWRAAHADKLEDASTLLQRIKAERQVRHAAETAVWKEDVKAWEAGGKDGRKPRKPRKPKKLPPITPAEFADLLQLPAEWAWEKIENLGEVQLGRQRSPKNRSKDFPTKYIRAANITENGLDLTDILDMEFKPDEFQRYQLKYGDILISEASGSPDQVGKPAIWRDQIPECCFQNTVIRLRLSYSLYNEYFLLLFKHFYANGVFAETASGVGINHLSASRFASLSVPIAPLKEQKHIFQAIDSNLSIIEQLEQDIAIALRQAEALRQSILKKAFAGQLVPQDPNDEPASALLARIRAAKKASSKNGTPSTNAKTNAKPRK